MKDKFICSKSGLVKRPSVETKMLFGQAYSILWVQDNCKNSNNLLALKVVSSWKDVFVTSWHLAERRVTIFCEPTCAIHFL